VSCAKTAEPIEMPFGILSRVDPRNHVLGWFQMPNGKGHFYGSVPLQSIGFQGLRKRMNCAKTGGETHSDPLNRTVTCQSLKIQDGGWRPV